MRLAMEPLLEALGVTPTAIQAVQTGIKTTATWKGTRAA